MYKQLGLVLILFFSFQAVRAEQFSYYIDGNVLWSACQSDAPFAYGIIAGIHDALSEAYSKTGESTLRVCTPDNVTIPMIKKTICEDLEEHENIRILSAVQVVWSSMLVNYPCP